VKRRSLLVLTARTPLRFFPRKKTLVPLLNTNRNREQEGHWWVEGGNECVRVVQLVEKEGNRELLGARNFPPLLQFPFGGGEDARSHYPRSRFRGKEESPGSSAGIRPKKETQGAASASNQQQ